jgi:HSP20 family protein
MTMSVRDLIPWGREESRVPSLFRDNERDPFLSLHREVNRLFDDVFRGFDGGLPSVGRASPFGGNWPSVEISDNDKEIKVTAEVPGMEEKDIEVLLDDGVLTLRGGALMSQAARKCSDIAPASGCAPVNSSKARTA